MNQNAADPADSSAFARVEDAPRSDEPDLVAALAADLDEVGYRHDQVTAVLGEQAMDALLRTQTVPAELVLEARVTEGRDTALDVLITAFLLGGSVSAERWRRALPRTGSDGALRLGLIEPDPEQETLLRAAVDLRPHATDTDAELWVASDVGAEQRPGVLRHDHVLGIGRASLTLASATIRRPAQRALDLGVGCGIQTFHLLSHCDHVTATDLSERALAFTRFNLLLNARGLGLDPTHLGRRVRLLQGSMLDPVAGEEFDLVVTNPPFVITPRRVDEEAGQRFTYRDGGLAGDRLVSDLVGALPGVLAPGGTAQLLANWEIGTEQEDWSERVAGWVPRDAECWVIQRDVEDPTGYAETWLQDAAEARDPQAYRERYRDYLEDFAARGVAGVGLGLIWLRRPGVGVAGMGRRFEAVEHAVQQPLGPALADAVFRADAVAAADVGNVHAVVGPDVTMETHSVPGEDHPRAILLRQGAGLRRVRALDTALAGLVSACDGDLSLRSIATAVTALLQAQAGQGEDEHAVEALLDQARELLCDGFLVFERPRG